MVKFLLSVFADLENVTNLELEDEHSFQFKVKCGCGEVSPKRTFVILNDTISIPRGSRLKEAHIVQKCKLCEKKGAVLMVPGYGKPSTSMQRDFAPVMMFDCSGYEPEDFLFFGGGWKAESTAWTKYEDINLADGEFVIMMRNESAQS